MITYEEALGTLTAMFTTPWTEDSLDTVLRHFEGHMENTVDAVLSHGDAPPADLIQRLESSQTGASISDMDAQLARQLADQETQVRGQQDRNMPPQSRNMVPITTPSPMPPAPAPVPTPVPTKEGVGRGTPTTLPPDFLRIPSAASSTSDADIANDEALARMLQDKLFAEELKNNPEFAHLARGGAGSAPGNRQWAQRSARRPGDNGEPPEVLKALAGMGEQAKKRFQDLATKFKKNLNQNQTNRNISSGGAFGGGGGTAERRGLLDIHDDDEEEEQEISFVGTGGAGGTHEMRSMDTGFAVNKKHD